MTIEPATLFWRLADRLRAEDPRVVEGTMMGGRCLRLHDDFLALVDYKGSGLVVKMNRERVQELIAEGAGRPFAPANRVFKEWISVPVPDEALWWRLLAEGVSIAAARSAAVPRPPPPRSAPPAS